MFTSYTAQGLPDGTSRGNDSLSPYDYDGVQRLSYLGHWFPNAAGNGLWTYARNPAGQIAGTTSYADTYAWTGHYAVNRNYTTDGLNRYSQAGNADFAYDPNGNLVTETSATGTRTWLYDVENRLAGAPNNVTLSYDPLGRLYRLAVGGTVTTTFLYDGDALVAEYDNAGAMTRRYVHWAGADVPVVSYPDATLADPSYLYADHQGSIVAVANANGQTIQVNRYDEYGIPAATNTGRFQYTGQIWLPELGMYHYKARVYSPYLGRFLQTDPIGYEGGNNLYAYVGNDPVNLVDPEGEQPRPPRIAPPVGRSVRTLNEQTANTRAVSALRTLQRADPEFREPQSMRNTDGYRTAREGDFLIGAHMARRMTGYYGRSIPGQTMAGNAVSGALVNATYNGTTQGRGQTYQYGSSGSGLAAFNSITGGQHRTESNGTLVATGVNMGGGVTGTFNFHRGTFAGRNGWVLEGQFSAAVTGSRIQEVFRIKIEYLNR